MPARVLFVDDDVALLKSIQRNLCFDYDLSIAESGQHGLELIKGQKPYSGCPSWTASVLSTKRGKLLPTRYS
jgi:DNA-binding NtrC family response regulator